MKKNDEFVVAIEDMSEDGAGIGRVDGYIWFIKDTVIGDVVRAGVMKMKKTYGFARLIEVVEPSKDRVEPRCLVARQCGGCQLQMMDYEAQLRFKERKIYNNLKRIGGMENLRLPGEECGSEDEGAGTGERAGADGRKIVRMEPIMGMEEPWRYRNKAQFPFGYGLTYGKVVVTDAVVSENSAADTNGTSVSGKAGFESGTNTTAAPVTIQATVTNQGAIDTRDVVQVYIKNADSSLAVPNPELAAFTPVFLKAGETKTVTLSIAPKAFTVVDETGARTEDGSHFHIYVGCTQPDKRSMELAGVKPVEIEYSK